MGRAATVAFCAALGLLAGATAHPAVAAPGARIVPAATVVSDRSWAASQIAEIVAAGVLGPDVESFRPADPLTRGELEQALGVLGFAAQQPLDPTRPVTMRELDARIVGALGLAAAARRYRLAVREAGLDPTGMLGTETVARMLGLRYDHPATEESLELGPTETATRAEAAFSLARVLRLKPDQIAAADELSRAFALPRLGDRQRLILARALSLVGYPYVWMGSSEKAQQLWSQAAPGGLVAAPGGFDCSGFVWRIYKLDQLPGAPALGATIKGRSSYAMSAEVPKRERISLDDLQPGDLAFFGDRGPRSRPAAIGHMGIYLGGGWMVHASGNGVTMVPLQGWYRTSFAWGRRPLAEAGLGA